MKPLLDILAVSNDQPAPLNQWSRLWKPVKSFGFSEYDLYKTASNDHLEYQSRLIHEFANTQWQSLCLGEVFRYGDATGTDDCLRNFFSSNCVGENAADMNGHFALFALNKKNQQLHVWTNRLGTMHIYMAAGSSGIRIGTDFASVAQVSERVIDWESLEAYFGCGFFLKDQTFFTDVKLIEPATHVVFSGSGKLLQSERYWEPCYQPEASLSFDQCVNLFADTLHEILEDMSSNGKLVLPISGGLDSRTLAAALTSSYVKSDQKIGLRAYSYGYTSYSSETAIAKQVADKRKLPLQAIVVKPYLFSNPDHILDAVQGFQEISGTRQSSISAEIDAMGDYLLAGHWGDVFLDSMNVSSSENSELDDLVAASAKKFLKKGRDWLYENLIPLKRTASNIDEKISAAIKENLESYPQIQDKNFKIKILKTHTWSFRWTVASLRAFYRGAFPRLPFYDNRIVDLLARIPDEYMKNRKLQIEYLKQYHPELAEIAWQDTGVNLFKKAPRGLHALPKRAMNKMRRIVLNQPAISRNWEVQFLNPAEKKFLKNFFSRKNLLIYKYCDQKAIIELIRDVWTRPQAGNGYALSMLLTFTLWLEKISGKDNEAEMHSQLMTVGSKNVEGASNSTEFGNSEFRRQNFNDEPLTVLIPGIKWPAEAFIDRLIKGYLDHNIRVVVGATESGSLLNDHREGLEIIRVPSRSMGFVGKVRLYLKVSITRGLFHPLKSIKLWMLFVKRTKHKSAKERLWHFARALSYVKVKADIIHYQWNSAAIDSLYLSEFLSIPQVISCRGAQVNITPTNPREKSFLESLSKSLIRADHIHCVSNHLKENVLKYGGEEDKITVVTPAVDINIFDKKTEAESMNNHNETVRLISVGSLIWRKGYEFALHAVKLLMDEGLSVSYTIIGHGRELERVLFTIEDLGLEKFVKIIPYMDPQSVAKELNQHDIFMCPSLSEGIPNALLEAMACGLATVSFDFPGVREVIEPNVNGMLTPLRDARLLSKAVRELCEDAFLRESMGTEARQTIHARFLLRDQVENLLKILYQTYENSAPYKGKQKKR